MEDFTSTGQKALNIALKDQQKNADIFNKHLINHSFIGKEFDTTEYLRHVYQASYDIKMTKKEGKKLNPLLAEIKNDKIGWSHRCYDASRFKQNEQDEFLVNPFHVEEGVNQCNKCNSKRVISYSVQTRSSDEPSTTFCSCVKCGTQWSYSG